MSVEKEICVPDIGGAVDVDVIEVQVAVGDTVSVEDSLITLEGDKATMEIPSPAAGTVKALKIAIGDKVSEGASILVLDLLTDESTPTETVAQAAVADNPQSPSLVESPSTSSAPPPAPIEPPVEKPQQNKAPIQPAVEGELTRSGIHAGPAVRRLARELGVDLAVVKGSGEKGRIIKSDVDNYVKHQLSQLSSATIATGHGLAVAPAPTVDFSAFGETKRCELTRIKKHSGAALHRNWVTIPHVTQFGEADITELEAFRGQHKAQAQREGFKLTPIVFVMKTIVAALKAFPHFNASLDPDGAHLIVKQYVNIGVAVDTPGGLVVPVIRHVDKKSLFDLARELATVSEKARAGTLSVSEMQGSSFTLSSLGGIGGTAFTPIINAPDVAILGVSKAQIKPVYQQDAFVPRLMLPLSLSYDHRVIDGADGARFLVYLSDCLSDVRRLLL